MANLLNEISTVVADETSTSSVEQPLYVSAVERIRPIVTKFKNFLADTAVQKDLRQFLEIAHYALKELFKV